MKACSRWLSVATPPELNDQAIAPRRGASAIPPVVLAWTASSLQSEPRDLQTSHTALTILSRNASIISLMYPLPRLAVIACLVYAFAASADEKPKGEASDPEVLAVELVKGFKVTGTLTKVI